MRRSHRDFVVTMLLTGMRDGHSRHKVIKATCLHICACMHACMHVLDFLCGVQHRYRGIDIWSAPETTIRTVRDTRISARHRYTCSRRSREFTQQLPCAESQSPRFSCVARVSAPAMLIRHTYDTDHRRYILCTHDIHPKRYQSHAIPPPPHPARCLCRPLDSTCESHGPTQSKEIACAYDP